MKRKIYLLSLGVLFITQMLAQSGRIKGQVAETIEGAEFPVPFANVFLEGTTIGTATDIDGNFSFDGPAGVHNLIISSVGMQSDTFQMALEDGEEIEIRRLLKANALILNAVEVTAKMNRERAGVLLMEQKNASSIQQSIGASELALQGASDVEQGVQKISGVSVSSGSNDVFVRGLGDRYNSAMLNGLPIPSSNPDKKLIDLAIFPNSIVQSIAVYKAFDPSLPGDFTGATIDVQTKDYFEQAHVKASLSFSGNSITTFRPFESAHSGANNIALVPGYKNRELPPSIDQGYHASYFSSSPDAGPDPFARNLNPVLTTAMLGSGLSIEAGNAYSFGKDGLIGVLVSADHGNGYQTRTGLARNLDNLGVDKNYFQTTEYDHQITSTGLTNVYLQPTDGHVIQVSGLFTQNSSDAITNYDALIRDRDRNSYLYSVRNTLRVNTLSTGQVRGDHSFGSDRFELHWGASMNRATNEEPDRSQLLYEASDASKSDYTFAVLNASDNHRYYSSLAETELNGRAALTWNFLRAENAKPIGKITLGASPRWKQRDFSWRQFNIQMKSYADAIHKQGLEVSMQDPDAYLNSPSYISGLYQYTEARDGSRVHFAKQDVMAGYVNAEYLIGGRLLVAVGARVEQTSQMVQYKLLGDRLKDAYRTSDFDTLNVLPSLNLKLMLNEKSNLRMSASQTTALPNFRELAPFQYQDQSRRLFEGNVDLTSSYAYNVDLKYERFPSSGKLLALTAFGKYIENPIERFEVPTSGTLFTYFNLGSAVVGGIEMESRFSLGDILTRSVGVEADLLDNVTLGLNAALNHSKFSLGTSDSIQTSKGSLLATNAQRPMLGASPYLIASSMSYEIELGSVRSTITVAYSVFGPRIVLAGTYGKGDVYERPVNTLDLVLKNTLSEHFDLNISIKNLLNPRIVQTQDIAEKSFVINEYKMGINYSLSLSYRFSKA
ncbi:MAG: TonB-dependent receptor [Cryomorphaceae bacterium]